MSVSDGKVAKGDVSDDISLSTGARDKLSQLALHFSAIVQRIVSYLFRLFIYSINQIQQEPNESGAEHDLQCLEHVAPPDERVFDQEDILKLGKEGWQARRLVLTKSDLFLTHPGDEFVSEKIPLVMNA